MPKFRKKPVVIDAIQLPQYFHTKYASLSDRQREFGALIVRPQAGQKEAILRDAKPGDVYIWITGAPKLYNKDTEGPSYQITGASAVTLEGIMEGGVGDFLITGVKNERYFCKADIFEATYEAAE